MRNVVSRRNRAINCLSSGGFPIRHAAPFQTAPSLFQVRDDFRLVLLELSLAGKLCVLCTPGGVIERAQQFLFADFTLHNLGEERATLSLTEQLINITDQTFRQEDVGALLYTR
jgi:hypothetical protein